MAFTDRDFQASFAVEPAKFCYDCHAPRSKGPGDAIGEAKGIDCESCHVANDKHFATRDCSGCHEFGFPHRSDLMQSTLREHSQSPFAATSCADCHMGRHRDHRFSVTRNTDYLKSALELTAVRTPSGVAITLTTQNVGHKMPTGDLFRRLRIVVSTELDDEEVYLERHFEKTAGENHEISDTRIDQTRTVTVDGEWLTVAPHIDVVLRYERVAETSDILDQRGGKHRRDALFSSIVLAEQAL